MITRDLRHAIARAVAAAGFNTGGFNAAGPAGAVDPGLRPTGTPGQYAASVALTLGANPRETAATLAATLARERWIARAEVTGPGYLTITVTPETLAAVADKVIAAGPACVTSDALAGVTVPAAPKGDPLTPDPGQERTWEQARAALAARLTARLAAAAGATIAENSDTERERVPRKEKTVRDITESRIRSEDRQAESDVNARLPQDPSEPARQQPTRQQPARPIPAPEVPPHMSGASRHDIYGNFMTRGERALGATDTGTSPGASGASRPRSANPAAAPRAAERRHDTEAAQAHTAGDGGTSLREAIAFAGRDAVTFTLARAIPGKPLRVDQQIIARHVPGNPAYAVRYAHARAASGVRWAVTSRRGEREGTALPCPPADPGELALFDALSWLPERVATAARRGRPDEFARYLEDLASVTVDVLSSARHPGSAPGSNSAPQGNGAPGSDRLTLAMAARTGLAAGLGLLEVAAPERL